MKKPESLWTADETATFLATSTDYLKKLRSQKKGPPYFKSGRFIRYHPAQVRRWLGARQQGLPAPMHTVPRPLVTPPPPHIEQRGHP